jgi:putative oxygen-independent coproporphyrinogen III oxidase
VGSTAVSEPASAWLDAPVESGPAAGFGVYLHVPFCHHRCGYCDFATAAVGEGNAALFDRYTAALVADLARMVEDAPSGARPWPTVTSVFVGGGTPSLLGHGRITRILDALRAELDVDPDAEITVECNPEDASVPLFAGLASAGVGRVSMGAQSFAPHVLAMLERGHGPEAIGRAVGAARDGGITQVGVDLIYGTPGETDADWRASLEHTLVLGVDHVSAYALTIHDNTPFGRAVARGVMPGVDDDLLRRRFEMARAVLGDGGLEHYEVSNWARGSACRSRHNLLYWRHGDYLGVGVGAHGHVGGVRWWSTRSIERYLDVVEQGGDPATGRETLAADERATERLMLGLRVREGLHPHDLPPLDPIALEETLDAGLVELACGRLRATERGWFLLDDAVARLTA